MVFSMIQKKTNAEEKTQTKLVTTPIASAAS